MSRKQILEMASAAMVFILGVVAGVVFLGEPGGDSSSWEIAEIKAGQGTDNPASETAITFSNGDFSKAVSKAVASHAGFKLRTKGQRPKNPEFNFTLLFFVNSAAVIPSEVVTGGYEAYVNLGMMLLDTRNGSERFSGGFNGSVPVAKEMVPQAIIDGLSIRRSRGGAEVREAEDSAENDGRAGAAPASAGSDAEEKKTQNAFEGEIGEDLRNAFLKALDRALSLGFDDAARLLRIQQMGDSDLVKMLKTTRGCPSKVLLDVLNDRRPADAFDYLLAFVENGPDRAETAAEGEYNLCSEERLRSAAILGGMGRREAVPVLIEFAERTDDITSMMTALAPIAQLGGDQAVGYMFILSTGHISETIQKAASMHLKTMTENMSDWIFPAEDPEAADVPGGQ